MSQNDDATIGQQWLRGYQTSDASGLVMFQTIVPGWYPGRTPHIHFKVRPKSENKNERLDFTSQLYFNHDELKPIYKAGVYAKRGEADTGNHDDMIFIARLRDDSRVGEHTMLELVANKDGKGYTTALPILLTNEGLRRRRG